MDVKKETLIIPTPDLLQLFIMNHKLNQDVIREERLVPYLDNIVSLARYIALSLSDDYNELYMNMIAALNISTKDTAMANEAISVATSAAKEIVTHLINHNYLNSVLYVMIVSNSTITFEVRT